MQNEPGSHSTTQSVLSCFNALIVHRHHILRGQTWKQNTQTARSKIVNACIIKITEVGCGFAQLEN